MATKKAAKAAAVPAKTTVRRIGEGIEIRKITRQEMLVTVRGLRTSVLLMNNGMQAQDAFDKRDAEPGKVSAKSGKNRTKDELFEASKYKRPDGSLYLPSTAFKKAMVDAASDSGLAKKDASKAKARGCFYVRGEDPNHPDQITVVGDVDRFDTIGRVGRPGAKVAIPRSRARLRNWTAQFIIEYNDRMRPEDILHLLNIAGDSQGVGDWRPGIVTSSGGECGRFEIVGATTIAPEESA